uniref:BRCA2 n=1 Tax=Anisakis simplex TaxID=6269 RepID=A0A0M3JJ15_ANISI
LINTHNKSVRSEERLSDSESTAAVCKGIVKDTGNGCENPAVRRSQRTVLLEPVVTRMTTRHAPSATSVPVSATNFEETNMPSLT